MINRTFTRNFNTTYLNQLKGFGDTSKSVFSFLIVSCMLICFNANFNVIYAQACPTAPTISAMNFSPADPCAAGNHSINNITPNPSSPGVG